MSEQSESATRADGNSSDAANAAAKTAQAARKRRWDRITIAVIIVLVGTWGVALYFHKELRAYYWAWKLASAKTVEDRDGWARYLGASGDVAVGPTLRLTRSGDAEIRAVGARTLIRLVQGRYQDQAKWIAMRLAQGSSPDNAKIEDDYKPDPRIAERLRELLADPDGRVRWQAIEGLVTLDDADSLNKLAELAGHSPDSRIAVRATVALSEIEHGPRSAELLRTVLAEAQSPDVRMQAIDSLRPFASGATFDALVGALSDVREVTATPRSRQIAPGMLAAIRAEMAKQKLPMPPEATTAPATQPEPLTVADFADRALRQLTGKDAGFNARAPEADRKAAIERWKDLTPKTRG